MTASIWLACVAALTASACSDKASTVAAGAADAMERMAGFRTKMCACKDNDCARRVSAEMAEWSKALPDKAPATMTTKDQKKATELGTEIGECLMRATTGNAPARMAPLPHGNGGPVVASADGSGGAGNAVANRPPRNTQGLPVECDDYKDAVTRLATCDTLAKGARDMLVKGYDEAASRWSSIAEAQRATLATSCQGGTDAVVAVGKAQCGW